MSGQSGDSHRYDDIIHLPHPMPKHHPRMPLGNRAAQFAPFAALVGYDAAIRETARLTGERVELDDEEKLAINGKLQWICDHIDAHPEVTLTYFQPDARKQGGACVDAVGNVKKVDAYERLIVMTDGRRIPMDELIAIGGEAFAGMEDGGS